jgi:hypothetical protein
MVAMFGILPIAIEQCEEAYWVGYAAKKTSPVKVFGNNVASSFQLDYKGKQVTVTNLHVCRIPMVLENRRRKEEAKGIDLVNRMLGMAGLDQHKLKKKKYPRLTDEYNIGKYIEIGDYKRKILAVDKFHDLCILEGDINKPSFSLANNVYVGELVRVIGYPRGLSRTFRKGRVMKKDNGFFPWLKRSADYLQISAIAYGGNSGSPIIDKYGRIVGVLFAGSPAYHTEVLVVPLEDLRNFLERHL